MSDYIENWTRGELKRSHTTQQMQHVLNLQDALLFSTYQPYRAVVRDSVTPFARRLLDWLSQFTDEEHRWHAFHSLKYFLFVGEQETYEMYRFLFDRVVVPWIADVAEIDIFAQDQEACVKSELNACWPCPATDSFRIGDFLHVTGWSGQTLRPDWRALEQLADVEKIRKYCSKQSIRYIALFEDFVGSGTQIKATLEFALSAHPGPILFAPMVVCKPGHEKIVAVAKSSVGRLRYSPILLLENEHLVRKVADQREPASFAGLRSALEAAFELMRNSTTPAYETAFGFKGVGSLYASYGNCPNNTPPAYHRTCETWPTALFPRIEREKQW